MKRIVFFGITALMMWACSPAKQVSKTSATVVKNGQDTTEYELIITDPQFDQWYLFNYSDAKDRSEEYYENKNLVAAENWNDYYRSGSHTLVIDSYLDYRPGIHYGIELNRKLFWYFKYVEKNYKIHLFW